MLRAIIVDDEPLAHRVLTEYIQDVPFISLIGQCYSATEALVFMQEEKVDLMFLDIHMPRLKGLDFLRTLQSPPSVIITSAYGEYALEGFELNVVDYLVKPISFERFLKAVQRASIRKEGGKEKHNTISEQPTESESSSIFVKTEKRLVQINFAEVNFLESYGNFVKVWLKDEYHLTPQTLTHMETVFPSSTFKRIHKSFVVNISAIDYVEGNRLFLKDGKELPIGKNFRSSFKRFLEGK
ncbi:MAG: LytTR family DNA-binding domain-containing protein [Bacteroidota bacterium]